MSRAVCEICRNSLAEPGEVLCAECKQEIAEQLARMDGLPEHRCAVCDAEVSGAGSCCRLCARERDEQLARMEADEFTVTHAMRGYLFAFDQFLRGEGSRAAMTARLLEMYREKGLEPPVAVKRRVEVLRFMSQNGSMS